MSFGNALWFVGILAEASVIAVLCYRRVWRSFPLFFSYLIWDFCMNLGIFALMHFAPARYTFNLYLGITVVDSIMQFVVLVELAWSVLRPMRSLLTLRALAAIAVLLLLAAVFIWPFAAITNANLSHPKVGLILQTQHTVAILRIIVFVVIASFSQFLSLGWRDRELQIATGFGLFAMVSIAVAAIHPAGASTDFYQMLNSVLIGSFICCLCYWFYSFLRQEAERREFDPQMREILLSVAGAARTTRAAMEASVDRSSSRSSGR